MMMVPPQDRRVSRLPLSPIPRLAGFVAVGALRFRDRLPKPQGIIWRTAEAVIHDVGHFGRRDVVFVSKTV